MGLWLFLNLQSTDESLIGASQSFCYSFLPHKPEIQDVLIPLRSGWKGMFQTLEDSLYAGAWLKKPARLYHEGPRKMGLIAD